MTTGSNGTTAIAAMAAEAERQITNLTPAQVADEMAGGEAPLVDLRESEERQGETIAGVLRGLGDTHVAHLDGWPQDLAGAGPARRGAAGGAVVRDRQDGRVATPAAMERTTW